MANQQNAWPKKITVDKRIVQILSGSTYSNFPSAIRELITNSYDADASNVDISIDLENEIITVADNGKGMNESDFAFYLRIAGKSRKKENTTTKMNRKIVGQFGVGFLSVLPFCERYLIETKKKGSAEIVYATIASTEYFDESLRALDVDDIPITGGLRLDEGRINEQFTRIRLVGFSKLTRAYFNKEYSIASRRKTKLNFDPMSLLKWELEEYLPLIYHPNSDLHLQLNRYIDDQSIIPFNVYLNKQQLYRQTYADNILEIQHEPIRIGEISFKYFFMSDYHTINPSEARYLLFRNLNVGVGERTTLGLGQDGRIFGKLPHITGEVQVLDGLNDLISVSRDKFNFSPDYEAMKEFLRGKFAKLAYDLDAYRQAEKIISTGQDSSKVNTIQDLKKDNFEKEISQLEKKGFTIRTDITRPQSAPVQINQEAKEIILNPSYVSDYDKLFHFSGKEFKLKASHWDTTDSLPAIRKDGAIYKINENYSLFREKNFDTFLKMNLVLFEYVETNKINLEIYNNLINDLSKITS
ncbi:ATP-binding protein [Pedobacter alluvionis]|uniref:Histidine kinase/DNA gyrase B/HSP90-like ATPase n=1 Tax=Pedobacter alluvionis TaxID=475253 RepID=A0A497Y2L6_9SPHI|nr:ATP-binding protein [Pedobacter alluvionis]RLJ77133.1 histidine kinase/DNA gyrase B/HSP90-like ATPase [Pedobacter alluvionis]TFB33629.1 hypothetical protein E3V97_06190 [Pedobacter alluvionis]